MKKKGFTLIELLAVIVILAIIALIAVPVVLNIIEKARSGAAKSSAYSYIKAVETYAVTSELDNKNKLEKNGRYNVTTSTTIDGKTYESLNNLVEIKGSKPIGSDDYILLDDSKNVKDGKLTIDNYVVTIKDGNIESVTKGDKVNIKVESIILTENSISIGINDTYKINATILPENATDKSITYESEDSSIAEVDSTGTVTGKKVGTTNIILKTSNDKTVTLSVTITQKPLADVVQVGDYVAYDAGVWTSSAEKPTSHGQFGGYTKGQNKANSVEKCNEVYKGSTTLKGWRVFSVDTNTKTVTLIHAGEPECYYHGTEDPDGSVAALNNRANSQYLNSNYANSAHMMNKDETDKNILRGTGSDFWLATVGWENALYSASGSIGVYSNAYGNIAFGIRPVVVLKSNILTNGKGTDMVGQVAWTLVRP